MSSSKRRRPDDDRDRWLRLTQRYLRFGTRSTAQVRAYLASRGAPARAIEKVLAQATQRGWLNDRLCGSLIASSLARRGVSNAAIHDRLTAQGLDERLVLGALKAAEAEFSEAARVRQLAGRWLRRSGATPQRVARRLAQRGFAPELIEQILPDVVPPDTH